MLPLTLGQADDEALLAEIALNAEYEVNERFFITGSVGYSHNFMDSERTVDARFVEGSTPFSVRANGFDEDIFSLGLGARWHATDALIFNLNYRVELGSEQDTTSAIGVGASYSF